jgi:hypothetical protein
MVNTVSVSVGGCDSVGLWVSRAEPWACLVIHAGGGHCEVQLDRTHVEALRDQLPQVLAGLDQWVAEEARCATARTVQRRVGDTASRALDLAVTADAAAAHAEAESLRAAVGDATAKAKAVSAAVRAFEEAALDADEAAEQLVNLTGEIGIVLRRVM